VPANAGQLWVEIIPTIRGFAEEILRLTSDDMLNAGRELGAELGSGLVAEATTASGEAARAISSDIATSTEAGARTAGEELRSTLATAGREAGAEAGAAIDAGISGGSERANLALREVVTTAGATGSAALETGERWSYAGGRMGGAIREASSAVDALGPAMRGVAAESESVWSRVGGALRTGALAPITSLRDTAQQYGLTAGTAFTLAGVAAAGMGIRFDAAEEQSRIAFTTMLHSSQAAGEMIDHLNQLAATTPFELGQVTTAAQRLLAFGFQAQDVVPVLTSIGDAVSGLGGDAQMLDRVTEAIGQMSAKGRVQSDEILQLTEAGIPALRILANQMHVTTGELSDMIQKGLVPSSQAIPQLLSGIEQGTTGAAGATQAFAGMMSAQSQSLTGMWSNFIDNTNRALGRLFEPAMPAIKATLGGLTTVLGDLPGLITRLGQSAAIHVLADTFRDLGRFAGELIPVLANVWSAIQPVAAAFGGALLGGLREAARLLADVVGPALVAVSGWLRPLMPVVVGIGAAFAAWAALDATIGVLAKAFVLVRDAIMGVRIAFAALSIAFETNPLGIILLALTAVVVGVIYAWQHFQGFRDVVLGTWHAIETAGRAVWDWLQGAFAWLGNVAATVGHALAIGLQGVVIAFHAVGDAAVWVWRTILEPAFRGIALAAEIAFLVISTALIAPLVFAFRELVAPVALWLWHTVIEPVAGGIAAAFRWLYDNGIRPVIDFIRFEINGWAAILTWLWHTVIEPVAGGIAAAFRWLWDTAISIVGTFIRREIDGWAAIFRWLNDSVVQPVWHAISTAFHWLWDTAVSVVGGFIRREIDGWAVIFHWLHDNAVRPVMDAIGAVIRWTHDNVIAPVLAAGGEAVHGLGAAFDATAEWIGRAWDRVKAAAAVPVNFVITDVYDNGIRATWNWIADHVGLHDLDLPYVAPVRFAGGGLVPGLDRGVDEVPALLRPGEIVLSPEQIAGLGGPQAVLSAVGPMGPGELLDGVVHAQLGAWIQSNVLAPLGSAADTAWSTVTNVAGTVVDFVRDPVGSAQRLLSAIVNDGAGFLAGAGDMGRLALGVPGGEIRLLVDHLRDWWSRMAATGGAAPPGQVSDWIAAALSILGFPQSYAAGLYQQAMTESSGNPRAVQGIVDINSGGNEALGLMQVIPPTFRAYALPGHTNPFDPIDSVIAASRYAMANYGPSWFAPGPWHSHGYDTGGLMPPGLSLSYNGTGSPEPVLSPGQWDALTSGAAGPSVEIHVSGEGMNPTQVAAEVERRLLFALR
jgi:tape measure domain-containing protein